MAERKRRATRSERRSRATVSLLIVYYVLGAVLMLITVIEFYVICSFDKPLV
jgi:hypothetical protein